MTLKEIAKHLDYKKVEGFWFSDFYLNMLSGTPYQVGASVYLGDGVSIRENGLTNAELKQLYKDELEMQDDR
jgi:hypothetical protein